MLKFYTYVFFRMHAHCLEFEVVLPWKCTSVLANKSLKTKKNSVFEQQKELALRRLGSNLWKLEAIFNTKWHPLIDKC